MVVEGLFIIGHPHETAEDIKKYPEFAKKMDINHRALYFVMTPYPGTQIYRDYYQRKLIESFDWDSYCNFGTVVHLDNLKRAELRNLMAYCYGVTSGIEHMFKRQMNVPLFIFHLTYTNLLMLYFHDVQCDSGLGSRNAFMKSFFSSNFGEYRKKLKLQWWKKLYKLFSKTFTLRYQIDVEDSFVMIFQLERDDEVVFQGHAASGL